MQLAPRRQTALINVSSWERDAEFGVYPQGARAKEAVFSPEAPVDLAITPRKRYLFKRSNKRYPDQFWGEVIAYRIGCKLGLVVPPAFVAWTDQTGHCAALIEWFYVDGDEVSSPAGDFLQQIQPDFDRKMGRAHNLHHVSALLRTFTRLKLMEENVWRQWWVDALLFDALIGNTDRHQDNWGFLFQHQHSALPRTRLMPLFDHGTSLGHEYFVDKVTNWREEDYQRYIRKGTHHISWSLDEPRIKGHEALLEKVLTEWPDTRQVAQARLADVSESCLFDILSDLMYIDAPVPLSQGRRDFVLRLLGYRLTNLKALLS